MPTANKKRLRSFYGLIFSILVTASLASVSYADENIEVNVKTSKGNVLSGVNVYAFTGSGSYTGRYAVTDTNGSALFALTGFAGGNYKFRADYLGGRFWSQVVTLPNKLSVDLIIEEETTAVTVSTAAGVSSGTRVYLFSGTGSYLSRYGTTDTDGKVSFELPVGKDYKFRADMLGNQYWSDIITITSGCANSIVINAGGGVLQVTIDKAPGAPLTGINVYLFTASGSYLGKYQTTDASGIVRFNVPGGNFKVRADFLGSRFWTSETFVTGDTDIELTIPHKDITITTRGLYQGESTPLEGLRTYLFSSSGSYLSLYGTTGADGKVVFNLPEISFKVRSDYLGSQFWSEEFIWEDTTVDIPMSDAEITVTGSGEALEGVRVYVFSAAGTYLGRYGETDSDGLISFRLSAGSYNFRADYLGNQYWSGVKEVLADQSNPVSVSTGGGLFTLTVLKSRDVPLVGSRCYIFSEAGSYLSRYGTTDSDGRVSFNLADGKYKIRVDYLGSQFWTELYTIPDTLSGEFIIPHQALTVNIEGMYQGESSPITGINVYLFSSSGTYLSQYRVTDENGRVSFNLPEQPYKVRADYLGRQFWSENFNWQDATVTISEGLAEVHILNGTTDVAGARVYLFSESGSYLGRHASTDTLGKAGFLLPSYPFRFRADYNGKQKWSDNVAITSDQITGVDLNFSDQPVITFSADPATISIGSSSVLSWSSVNAESISIDQGIGAVELNGSISVSPAATTTYTITATGSGGTACASAVITVVHPAPVVSISADPSTVPVGGSFVLTWSSSNADIVSIDNGIGAVGLNGSLSVSPIETTSYTISAIGPGGTATGTQIITVNGPPAIALKQPDEAGDSADQGFIITWSDSDTDDNAAISLYYDADNGGSDGMLIVEMIAEDDSNNIYYWDTTDVPEGNYFIYAVIDDGINEPVNAYSKGPLTIEHIASTEYKISASNAASYNQFGKAVSISGDYAIVGSDYIDDEYNSIGSAYIFRRDGEIWAEKAMLTAGDADPDDQFGGAVSINGSYAIVGAPYDEADIQGGDGAGSAYIFRREGDSWIEQAKITAADAMANDRFGASVSINGEYAIVGAHFDDASNDDGYSESGSAYIFKRDGDIWTEQAKLTASDLGAGAEFGTAVSISGSYAVVGAPYDDSVTDGGKTDSGAVYIFKREGSVWQEQVKLTASDLDEYDEFGSAVSISGEYVVVGAHYDDSINGEEMESGSAYIFKRNGDAWSQQAKLTAPDADANDEFGSSVSISGNYAVIGVHYDDFGEGYEDAGSVYIFKRDGTEWSKKAKITPSDADSYDEFGSAVSINGNYAIAGAPYDETGGYGGYEAGSAYIFKVGDNAGDTAAEISADPEIINRGETSTLVWAVTGADSVTIDQGVGVVAVSGLMEVSPAVTTTYTITASGPYGDVSKSVTISVVDPDIPPLAHITATPLIINEGESSILSWSSTNAYSCMIEPDIGVVKLSGSISVTPSPGVTTYTVTATGAQGKAKSSVSIVVLSSAYEYISDNGGQYISISGEYAVSGPTIYKHDVSEWSEQTTIANTGPVSMDGDCLIVGDDEDDEQGNNSGAAYIYKRDGAAWIDQGKLLASDGEDYDYFGWAVSISGNYAVIGAPYADGNVHDSGAAYIFKWNEDAWEEIAKITAEDGDAQAWFGSSVAINGDYLIVGADGDLDYYGSAYIYKLEGESWVQQAKLTAGSIETDGYFGQSVAINDNFAIVGAWASETWPYSQIGSFYSFKREGSDWVMEQRVTADDMCTFQDLGYSMSLSGEYLAVGAPGDGINADFFGAVYIYKRGEYGWEQYSKLVEPERIYANKFGIDVSIDGTNVMVGTEESDSVYIFSITTLDIDLSADVILTGGSATLTWNTKNADSISIDHGIGMVDNSGSLSLTPTETTTYTFTVEYNGNTTVKSVTIYVIDQSVPPAVVITPEQVVIEPGRSATFYWNSTNALSCSIDNGIGEVGINDSISISPDTTTTYTITPDGPAGTATATARVIVKPTVDLSATKDSIRPGSSASLVWTSKNAEVCTIEPGIGTVPLNGSIMVSPAEETTYTIIATGEGGTVVSEITVYVVSLDIDIHSPSDGSTIGRPDVMVKGMITNIPGCETGVTVNGVTALVFGSGTYYEFAAMQVPLEEGENEITVSVIDADGYETTATITVYAEISDNYITASLYEESGVYPFETILRVGATFPFEEDPEIKYSGPDYVSITKIEDEYNYTVAPDSPGLYYITVEAEYEGETYTDTVSILVNDQDEMNALLKAKWNKMKEALIDGDIENALTYYLDRSKEKYQEIFDAFADSLSTIASDMREIELIYVYDNLAKYRIKKEETLNGQVYDITYFVYFVKGLDGIWKIESF